MSFVIDFTHHHSQSLLDLVNYVNRDTVYVPLTTDKITVENIGPPTRSGQWRVKLAYKTYPADSIIVEYTKISLSDFITIPERYLDWFDLSNGVPPDLSVWSVPALEAFESTCRDYGLTVPQAWESPAQCHVEYDRALDRYVLIFECESFIYSHRSTFVLPYHLGQGLHVTQLDGLHYDLAGLVGRKLQDLVTVRRLSGFIYKVFP